jgi:hypothetical protein
VQKVEVLSDNRRSWPGEVERERVFHRAEVVEFEYEVFRQTCLVAPNHPTNADVGKTKLMATGVDGNDTRKFEIP